MFSHSVISDSLQAHGWQHARHPCPSPSPWVCSNSCPLSWWCHPTISSCDAPFSSCPQSFLASGSFLMSWLFASGGQNIESSASACLFHEYSAWVSFRIEWFDLLAIQETLKSLLQYHSSKASVFQHSAFFMIQVFNYMDFCQQNDVSAFYS